MTGTESPEESSMPVTLGLIEPDISCPRPPMSRNFGPVSVTAPLSAASVADSLGQPCPSRKSADVTALRRPASVTMTRQFTPTAPRLENSARVLSGTSPPAASLRTRRQCLDRGHVSASESFQRLQPERTPAPTSRCPAALILGVLQSPASSDDLISTIALRRRRMRPGQSVSSW